MLEFLVLFTLAAGQCVITQRESIEICLLDLSKQRAPNSSGNLVIQLSSKDISVPLLLLINKNWDPLFRFNATVDNYQVNASYSDFEAWSQNLPNSYIKLPNSSLNSNDILHIGIYSEVMGVTYTISWTQSQSNECTPQCVASNGRCTNSGSCECDSGPYSGYDCGVPFTGLMANDTGEDLEVMAGSWAFFYFNLSYTKDFTLKISNPSGDPRFYFKLFTEDQYLPSMFYAWLQMWFGDDETAISYDFPNGENLLWTFSVLCRGSIPCKFTLKESTYSDSSKNYIWLVVAIVVTVCLVCFLIPIAIRTLIRYRSIRMAQIIADRRANPLTPEEMEKLFPEKEWSTLGKEKESCAICLEDFEAEARVRMLSCEHFFHTKCIDEWAQTNAKCPLCKKNLSQENLEAQESERVDQAENLLEPQIVPRIAFASSIDNDEHDTNQETPIIEPLQKEQSDKTEIIDIN
ncbi:unnamed protein product [Blepharisma stoltei]|uniref:RING-type domain-containing protein n=1 Tax=Blepharisma stoltei TaxID=1481888 RepID=A0AAU9JD46_9CILI|nr:unnamed protein product [Blepharisma stoltei]